MSRSRLVGMPFIATIAPERAEGLLRRIYASAIARAGKVFAVIRIQSQQPRVLGVSGSQVAFADRGGNVWVSVDAGRRWSRVADRLPPPCSVLVM